MYAAVNELIVAAPAVELDEAGQRDRLSLPWPSVLPKSSFK